MWFLLLFPVFLLLFYLRRKNQQQVFKSLGIPGPEPHWFFGNLLDFNPDSHPFIFWIKEGTKKYGKIWGYYEGPKPILVISDLECVQDAFVKHFASFHGRRLFVIQEDSDKDKNVSMFNAHGSRWKRLRTIVNPAFTEVKMRKMFPLMKRCIDVLMSNIDRLSSKGESFDVFNHYKRLTMEVIGECAFGTALNIQNDDNPDNILSKARILFQTIKDRNFIILFAEAVPELVVPIRKLLTLFAFFSPARRAAMSILSTINNVIQRRKEDASLRRMDILQLMLDAESSQDDASSMEGQKALNKNEIASQSFIFFVAGFETSSNALGIITHLLATHPEVQERAQYEVDSLYENCDDPSHLEETSEHLAGMEYLNNVITEALRCYPIAPHVVSRRAMSPGRVGGHLFPAGTNVIADVLSIHQDPEVWGPEDPTKFDPDRLADGRKREAAAFLGFGCGPRFCIGQRFALTEIRAVLFRLLRRYNIRATQSELKLNYKSTVTPLAVNVSFEPRGI